MTPRRVMRLEAVAGAVCWVLTPILAYFFLQPHLIGFPLVIGVLVSAVLAHGAVIAVVRALFSE